MHNFLRSISVCMFALLALVVMSFPTNSSAMAGGYEPCMACFKVQMPPGVVVSALAGTKDISKVATSSGIESVNSIHSHGFIKLMAEGGGDWISNDALVSGAGFNTKRTYYAFHQNLILANRLRI